MRILPVSLLAAAIAGSLSAAFPSGDEDGGRTLRALLLNGGQRPASNYLSHLQHVEDMLGLLERRGVAPEKTFVFSADGEGPEADLAVRETLPPDFWLIDGTEVGKRLKPRTELTNTGWTDRQVEPARLSTLKRWFETSGRELRPGEPLFLFVTDHGTGNTDDPDNGAISLWNEKLTVNELRDLIGLLPDGARVVMVMSQCYSGSFANVMYPPGSGEPSGNVCGFFSTTRDLRAYGCYPEGRDRDQIGHAFRFIDALDRRRTAAEAHFDVLATDDSPDVPLRTSDVYLERLIAKEAAARGVEVDTLIDSLLAEAWRRRADWEPEIRLLDRIGEAFGTFSPRALSELNEREKELSTLAEQTYAERWELAFIDVKNTALRNFVESRPEWREGLSETALKSLDSDSRAATLQELLPHLDAFVRSQPAVWERLERLRENAQRGAEAKWRFDVRKAALHRMRIVLTTIAGRVLVDAKEGGDTFSRLAQCEALSFGAPGTETDALASPSEPFPTVAEEVSLLEELHPSWLGVTFGPVPKAVRSQREIPAGANMLRAVYPDSPAQQAGLLAGDIVLGPPDEPFESNNQLREWTMISPRNVPLPLRVLRPGDNAQLDESMVVDLILKAYPLELPKLPGPPQVGDIAPVLPTSLEPVGSELPELTGRSHLLFFWATWCVPCKRAVPEVLAFAEAKGVPAIAITDEEQGTVGEFLEGRREPFFEQVAVDTLRKSFISYGVSGTPTILLVDESGVIRSRQVGYNPQKGLQVEGWTRPNP